MIKSAYNKIKPVVANKIFLSAVLAVAIAMSALVYSYLINRVTAQTSTDQFTCNCIRLAACDFREQIIIRSTRTGCYSGNPDYQVLCADGVEAAYSLGDYDQLVIHSEDGGRKEVRHLGDPLPHLEDQTIRGAGCVISCRASRRCPSGAPASATAATREAAAQNCLDQVAPVDPVSGERPSFNLVCWRHPRNAGEPSINDLVRSCWTELPSPQ